MERFFKNCDEIVRSMELVDKKYANILADMFYQQSYIAYNEHPTILDTHDNSYKRLVAIIEFNSDNKGLAAFIIDENQLQCLNAVGFSDTNRFLYLSKASIGGVLNNLSEREIIKYNESCVQEGGHIKRVYFPDGEIWEI